MFRMESFVTVVYNLGISRHFGAKKWGKKNWQNSQRFLAISSLQAFFWSKYLNILIKYISYKKNFFGLGYWDIFESKKSYQKNRQNSKEFLNYTKSSWMIFCAKYSQIIDCLQEESTNFGTIHVWTISSLYVPKCPNTSILYITDLHQKYV